MIYRREIDGLRAIAVLPVILFHAGIGIFSGGFVGVDIFFVISGYLITSILINDIEKKRFSIIDFYDRRARRILPALFFILLVCLPFSWMWMSPHELKDFSTSLIAVMFFSSNILFWQQSDYFAPASEENPLLHTWSLAVEEQFYLLFPVFLILTWRFGKNRVFWLLLIMAIISLMISEWGWRNKASANFFLAPTRAWELLMGSITAFIVQKQGVKDINLLSLTGLTFIISAIFIYDDTTPFPSLYALLPTTGVVLLILFSGKNSLSTKLLSLKPLVGIGLISYSAYLWHQPVFAYARLFINDETNHLIMLLLGVMSIFLAYLTWKYIEAPFRDRKKTSLKQIFSYTTAGAIFFLGIGITGHAHNGFIDQSTVKVEKTYPVHKSINQDIWVLGDSHAEHLLHGLANVTEGKVKNMTSGGCLPLRDVDRYDFRFEQGSCASKMAGHLDNVLKHEPKAIILLSGMGPVYLDGTTFKGKDKARIKGQGVELITNKALTDNWEVYETGLRLTFEELSSLQNSEIIFAIDIPELGIDNGCNQDRKAIRTRFFELKDNLNEIKPADCVVSREEYDQRATNYKQLVYSVAEEFPSIHVYDPTDRFCTTTQCTGYRTDAGYLYKDFDHLSHSGSNYWATGFAQWHSEKSEKVTFNRSELIKELNNYEKNENFIIAEQVLP